MSNRIIELEKLSKTKTIIATELESLIEYKRKEASRMYANGRGAWGRGTAADNKRYEEIDRLVLRLNWLKSQEVHNS